MKSRYINAVLATLCALAILSPNDAPAQSRKKLDQPGRAWDSALEPLRTMPVQYGGFVRCGQAYAQDHLLAIYGKRGYGGRPALTTILWLLSDPEARREAPILKFNHPVLIGVYGKSRVSLVEFNDPEARAKLSRLSGPERASVIRAYGELSKSAETLEDLDSTFAIVPREDEWLSPGHASHADVDHGGARPWDGEIVEAWGRLAEALRADDAEMGAAAASDLAEATRHAAEAVGADLSRLRLDAVYRQHNPFVKSAFFYLLGALAYLAALLFGWRRASWLGAALLVVGLAEQTFGLSARWILSGRAPVANMYESFTFATAGMVLVALVAEAFMRVRLAGLGAAILAFVFMVLAHKAPIFQSEIRPLVPALQSSWLTYHVVTIMLSYSAFALSFFISCVYLLKDRLDAWGAASGISRRLPSLPSLGEANYKIIAVGFPLLTIGIVLGAVWANTAWGRPWGFDPKETWSAITWLIYAVFLHVRFIGGWRGRVAAVVAVIGFLCVLFTYVGVNYLLPSLHTYAR